MDALEGCYDRSPMDHLIYGNMLSGMYNFILNVSLHKGNKVTVPIWGIKSVYNFLAFSLIVTTTRKN